MRILCLDMGGTKLRIGIVEKGTDGSLIAVTRTLREDFPAPTKEDEVPVYIFRTLEATDGGYDGIACAIAGTIWDHRIVRTAPNVPWLADRKNFDLAAWFTLHSRKPVIIANDMEAALAGEVEAGALRGVDWAIMNTLSTGWGGANLYNGVAVAGEPGHVWLGGSADTWRCGCKRTRCPEAWFSGGAVRTRVLQVCRDFSLRIPDGTDPCTYADQEAEKGTHWARSLYTDVATGIGEIWGSQLNLCPRFQKIVYMGTFGLHAMQLTFFRERLRQALLARSLFRDEHEHLPIVPAEAPQGPLLGAARIFLQLTSDFSRAGSRAAALSDDWGVNV